MEASPERHRPFTIGYLAHGARNIGGGEYVLASLIRKLNRDLFRPVVFFAHRNEIIAGLEAEGVETVSLALNRKMISLFRDDVARSPGHLIGFLPAALKATLAVRRAILSAGIDLLLFDHPDDARPARVRADHPPQRHARQRPAPPRQEDRPAGAAGSGPVLRSRWTGAGRAARSLGRGRR